MPLIKSKSKKAIKANIDTLIHKENKKPDQAVAIAYAVQRKAKGKKKS